MRAFRRILTWLVLASYLFANTLASALHDHHACCDHRATGPHGCGGEHHHLDEGLAEHDEDGDGGELHAPHACVVCEFLAQAPLAPLATDLIPCGDLPPVEAPRARLFVATALAGRHLPRGPPTLS